MWKTALALSFVSLGAIALGGCSDEVAKTENIVCESTYAFCTTAKCTPIEKEQGTVFCGCEMKTGYSVGGTPCHEPIDSPEGKQVVSRYYPIKSYASCNNDRPWANCYDRPCIVDKDDPTKAVCSCNIVTNESPYVIVTDTYTDQTCTTGLYSSAKVKDMLRLTDSLKTDEHLKPYDLKVVNQ